MSNPYPGLLQSISNTSFRRQPTSLAEEMEYIRALMRRPVGNMVIVSQAPEVLIPKLILHDVTLTTLRMHMLIHKLEARCLIWGVVYRGDTMHTWYITRNCAYVGTNQNNLPIGINKHPSMR